ncbi:hypothetical protein TVAG_010720 [Trichomonas vaginalis G3]|uniref:DUF3447 domain-containing protein n=1 Tax=Trichomonas vaginalis (strain ATCC PRA-98 / G3) TaxID=412133 RepID=A2DNZ9_TRIV3|nr:protein ubiquitination [Trichomonas vaginalis G3]EAY17848.1 hypothetical protein TVAG_010720 [Trichomonas vaginalis G3]KAI5489952.1 protein ubiquitination [Trichomonas vaginalis G3]|eukprot:XP_001329983.1 hypothetical protein [Trichomonas vaginalis G3]
MFYEEFHIKFDFKDHQALRYFFNKEYGLPISYRDQKLFGGYSLDIHEKNTIYRSIMDDDKDSFIVFIESESFDRDQKLKHDLYPHSDEGLSYLELCCYHGAVNCFKLLRTKFDSEITPQCLQFSFLSGKPDILNECLKFQVPDQECMEYAIISFNIDFVTFLNTEYELEIDLNICRLWRNFQAFFIHLDISNDIENCFVVSTIFSPSLLEYFISQGVDVNATDNKLHRTALKMAALTGNKEAITLLVSHGAKINSIDLNGGSILDYVAPSCDKELIEFFIENGADITSTNLHSAANSNNYVCAEILISHGVNVNSKNNDGSSPLIIAAKHGYVEIVKLLLSHGAFINETDNEGKTALYLALRHNSIDIVKLLISHGADVNIKNNIGLSPLMTAIYQNCFEIAELLLSHGANINDKEIHGYSALHFATYKNNLDQAKFLVMHHIDINAEDNTGHNALDYAYIANFKEMILLLEQYGGQRTVMLETNV